MIKEQFSEAIEQGSVSHAYLLLGEKGMGKKMFARSLCLELFCEHPGENGACLSCPSCKKVISGNHPDVIWLSTEKPDLIRVDEIRQQIVDTVDIKPYLGRYKVYVIPDCERMNQQAQNALLKVLEEPPEYVIMLLLCGDETALLETVLSRTVKVKLKPRTDAMVKEHLRMLFPDAEEARIDLAVAFSRGNPGKAEELLGSSDFSEWYMEVRRLCRDIKKMDAGRISAEAEKLSSEHGDISGILDLIQLWYRDLMMFKVTKDIGGLLFKEERRTMMELAPICSYEGIEEIMDAIETCRIRLQANVNPTLALELLLLKMKEN